MFDYIIVKQDQISNNYGAFILQEIFKSKILNKITTEYINLFNDKKILLVGDFFRNELNKISDNTSVTIYLNSFEYEPGLYHPLYDFMYGKEGEGFSSFVIRYFKIKNNHMKKIAELLDDYYYNYTSKESIYFYLALSNQYDLCTKFTNMDDIIFHIEKGKKIYDKNLNFENINKNIKKLKFKIDGMNQIIYIYECNEYIIEILSYLSDLNPDGTALLFHKKNNKTCLSLKIAKKSKFSANILANHLFNGSGSNFLAIKLFDSIIHPETIFKPEYFLN